MAETIERNTTYEEIGRMLIKREPSLAHIAGSKARIAFLSSDCAKKSKGRTIFGECEKVPAKYAWAFPYDFTITLFEPNVDNFDMKRLEVLLLHELMHVGIEVDDDGEEHYSLIPHDYEEFQEIAQRFGTDWWLDE